MKNQMVSVNKRIVDCPKTNRMRTYGYKLKKKIELRKKLRLMFREISGVTDLDKIPEFTEEYRIKKSEAVKGENNPMYGKHHNKITKSKLSKQRKLWWTNYDNRNKGLKQLANARKSKRRV